MVTVTRNTIGRFSIYSCVPRGLLERTLVQLHGEGLDADVVDVVRLCGVRIGVSHFW